MGGAMHVDPKKDIERLASAIVDDLLEVSDEELLAELAPGEAELALSEGQAILREAKRQAGKSLLADARRRLDEEARTPRRRGPRLEAGPARRRLTAIVANASADSRVTLAARAGKGVPDEDLDGLVEDARDLELEIDHDTDGEPDPR